MCLQLHYFDNLFSYLIMSFIFRNILAFSKSLHIIMIIYAVLKIILSQSNNDL